MKQQIREYLSLEYKRQYLTYGNTIFFGPSIKDCAWRKRVDFPVRYFLHKANYSAWGVLSRLETTEKLLLESIAFLEGEIAFQQVELNESSNDEDDSGHNALMWQSPIETRTIELDLDEELILDCSYDELARAIVEITNASIDLPALTAMLSVVHVSNCVEMLSSNDLPMAAAHAFKAQEWVSVGLHARGQSWLSAAHSRQFSVAGTDKAHEENRRIRKTALGLYDARTWPSKMQAARVISSQVHRTELVVMRWIREHSRAE